MTYITAQGFPSPEHLDDEEGELEPYKSKKAPLWEAPKYLENKLGPLTCGLIGSNVSLNY